MDKWLKTGTFKRSETDPTIRPIDPSTSNEASTSTSVPGSQDSSIPRKKRKYDETYLTFGFTWTGNEDEPNGLFVECEKIVSNSSLNPAKLKRHMDSHHSSLRGKNIEYFQRKRDELKKKKTAFAKYIYSDNMASLEASFRISYRIAKEGEAYTIAEKLIKPCVKDIITCKLGAKYVKEINTIPLSDTTIARRIKTMSSFCEDELISRLKSPHQFTMQLDETTDVAGLAILIVLVRYVWNSTIEEHMLFCKPLTERATGEKNFQLLHKYMEDHRLTWDLSSHVCTDGAKALLGSNKGVVSRIKAIAPHMQHCHCCLHLYALVAKRIPKLLKDVLDEVVKIINFIKSKELNSRLFTLLCEELSSNHKTLLLHSEVRWLSSRGNILSRFFKLKDEVRMYLNERKSEYAQKLHDQNRLQLAAYLADIFAILNEINIKDSRTSCQLKATLKEYFPGEKNAHHDWMKGPFKNYNKSDDLAIKEKEQLIEIATDSTLLSKRGEDLLNFWLNIATEYPEISKWPTTILMPFSTTYLCEISFSTYVRTEID
ncbi:zinc finger BED domain-containing protein 5-like [Zophobas morio]|uniref:zinc finger BED domain-containing protein 5-like n=1 Tax=Zophobas morio TaxID=2755281 RepID=UPI003083D277